MACFWLIHILANFIFRSCDRPAYEILEGMIREKKPGKCQSRSCIRTDRQLAKLYVRWWKRYRILVLKKPIMENRVLCTSREDAEKYIEKTKLIFRDSFERASWKGLFAVSITWITKLFRENWKMINVISFSRVLAEFELEKE